ELLMKAVRKHTDSKWMRLYIERWLKAPAQQPDGTLVQRDKGTPQGGVVSPLLANLFLHYTFDDWMRRRYPEVPFERYADDIIVHCKTEMEAKNLKVAIGGRLGQCKLELHTEKTKVVYCKDDKRRGSYTDEKFDFLGFTFRSRRAKSRWGKYFISFSPAISNEATKSIQEMVRSWKLHRRSDKTLTDLSRMYNPIIRGWINYYGSYYKSALYRVFYQLSCSLVRWAMRKYKKLRCHIQRAVHWLGRIALREPNLFAHWQMGMRPTAGQ
ncbi:MAG: reverse transcriptase domain-containing protein, partial [Thermodesulfobacteriota bacterium]